MGNMQRLSDDSLDNVYGGKGQGVDDGAVRIELRNCPICCKPGELARFEIKNGVARCLKCSDDKASVLLEYGRA